MAAPIHARDLILCIGLALLDLVAFWDFGRPDGHPLAVVTVAFVAYGLLVFRRRRPLLIFGLVVLVSLLCVLILPEYRLTAGVGAALYTVASQSSRRLGLLSLLITAALCALWVGQEMGVDAAQISTADVLTTSGVIYGCAAVVAYVLGRNARTRKRLVAETARRFELESEEVIAADRDRVAAEMHDSLAHSVTVIILQAAGAREMVGTDSPLERVLGNIEQTARQAMLELRRVLDLIDEDKPRLNSAERLGLGLVPRLVDSLAGLGIKISLAVEGHPLELDAAADLAAYRVVQESLTNVAKHEGKGALVEVALSWRPDHLIITVTSHSDRSGDLGLPKGTGRGLSGMRQRVVALDGSVDVQTLSAGGFQVVARLPVSAGSAS